MTREEYAERIAGINRMLLHAKEIAALMQATPTPDRAENYDKLIEVIENLASTTRLALSALFAVKYAVDEQDSLETNVLGDK